MDTSPAGMIARLDASLARVGEDVVLRRYTQGPNSTRIPFAVTVRAQVRGYSPEELVGGITQQDSRVILSPTQIEAAQWPGPTTSPVAGDRRVPRKGDQMVIAGIARTVEAAAGIYVAGTLVRIECRVLGGPLP
jgi:hypothetical protein